MPESKSVVLKTLNEVENRTIYTVRDAPTTPTATLRYTGTALIGHAHADGTANTDGKTGYDMWLDYNHAKGAYVYGTQDWELPTNEEALVNELGAESIVYYMRHYIVICNCKSI